MLFSSFQTTKSLGKLSVMLLALALAVPAFAEAPQAFVQRTSNQLISILKDHQKLGIEDTGELREDLRKMLDQSVDFDAVSQSILGKQSYTQATSAQRGRIVMALRESLLSTYTAALASVDLSDIVVEVGEGKTRTRTMKDGKLSAVALVPVDLHTQTSTNNLVYGLKSSDGNTWKIAEMRFNNVSVTKAFRNQFAALVQQHENLSDAIDTLIETLEVTQASAGFSSQT